MGLSGSCDNCLLLFSFFPLNGLSKEPGSRGSLSASHAAPSASPPTGPPRLLPDKPTATLWPSADRQAPGSLALETAGVHVDTGFTPRGLMRLSPAGTAPLRLPMCILACKASVYKSGSKKDRNPNNSRFTEASQGLAFPFFLVRRQHGETWSSTWLWGHADPGHIQLSPLFTIHVTLDKSHNLSELRFFSSCKGRYAHLLSELQPRHWREWSMEVLQKFDSIIYISNMPHFRQKFQSCPWLHSLPKTTGLYWNHCTSYHECPYFSITMRTPQKTGGYKSRLRSCQAGILIMSPSLFSWMIWRKLLLFHATQFLNLPNGDDGANSGANRADRLL